MRRDGWAGMMAAVVAVPAWLWGSQAVPAHVMGGARAYTVVAGDTLRSISARYGLDVEVIRRDNNLARAGVLHKGSTLILDNSHIVPVPTGSEQILINVPQRLLFYFESGMPVRAFPVAVGQHDWQTPLAAFSVVMKEEAPTWDVPASIQEEMRRKGQRVVERVPPGPTNPLGNHWLGLSIPGIGIHGTPFTSTIYAATTHGCIRVHPDDVAFLFERVQPGATGRLTYQPILVAQVDGRILLEAHKDIYRRPHDDGRAALERLESAGARIDWTVANQVLAQRDGVARLVGAHETTVDRSGATESIRQRW
jgi:L,D-transpeptidase ErfK/SrfK